MSSMMTWTTDIIRFMRDASDNSSYFSELALAVMPYLNGCKTICDAGCGLGQLAVELAEKMPDGTLVEGIDINYDALRVLCEQVGCRQITNVICTLTDLDSYHPDKKFGGMVFNYFGSMEQIMKIRERCCDGPVVLVKRNYKNHRFSLGNKPITTFNRDDAVEYLTRSDIPFIEKSFSCEFGQPFRSLEDAVLFYKIFSRDSSPEQISVDDVRPKLVVTGNIVFPYYLPHIKESRIIVI